MHILKILLHACGRVIYVTCTNTLLMMPFATNKAVGIYTRCFNSKKGRLP